MRTALVALHRGVERSSGRPDADATPRSRARVVSLALVVSACVVLAAASALGGTGPSSVDDGRRAVVSGGPAPGTVPDDLGAEAGDTAMSRGLAGDATVPSDDVPVAGEAAVAAGGGQRAAWMADAVVTVVCALLALAGVVFSTVYPLRQRREAVAEKEALLLRVEVMQRRLDLLQRHLDDGAARPGRRSRPRTGPGRPVEVFDHTRHDLDSP